MSDSASWHTDGEQPEELTPCHNYPITLTAQLVCPTENRTADSEKSVSVGEFVSVCVWCWWWWGSSDRCCSDAVTSRLGQIESDSASSGLMRQLKPKCNVITWLFTSSHSAKSQASAGDSEASAALQRKKVERVWSLHHRTQRSERNVKLIFCGTLTLSLPFKQLFGKLLWFYCHEKTVASFFFLYLEYIEFCCSLPNAKEVVFVSVCLFGCTVRKISPDQLNAFYQKPKSFACLQLIYFCSNHQKLIKLNN